MFKALDALVGTILVCLAGGCAYDPGTIKSTEFHPRHNPTPIVSTEPQTAQPTVRVAQPRVTNKPSPKPRPVARIVTTEVQKTDFRDFQNFPAPNTPIAIPADDTKPKFFEALAWQMTKILAFGGILFFGWYMRSRVWAYVKGVYVKFTTKKEPA